jgi:hypothetical protein
MRRMSWVPLHVLEAASENKNIKAILMSRVINVMKIKKLIEVIEKMSLWEDLILIVILKDVLN